MKTKILQLLFLCVLSIYATHTQAQNLTWAKSTTGTSIGGIGTGIATDATGNVYTTGWFSGTTDFDFGAGVFNMTAGFLGTDAFISKTDAAGNFVWAKQLTGLGSSNGTAITVDAVGDIYAMGYFTGTSGGMSSGGQQDVYIRKLSPSGSTIWTRQINGGGYVGYARGTSITVDATGNVYATGTFDASFGFFGGIVLTANTLNIDDTFICKLDSSGDFVWAKKIGGTGETTASGIVVDILGNVYTTGHYSGTVDFDPNVGIYNLFTPSYASQLFLSKLDASGNFMWVRELAGGVSFYSSVAIDANNVYVAKGDIIKLDFAGNVIWTKTGYNNHAVKADALGNIYSLGTFIDVNVENIYIRKLDANGDFIWAKSMRPQTFHGKSVALALDNLNNVFITGGIAGTSDVDPNAGVFNIIGSTSNYEDIFVAKYSQCPVRVTPISLVDGTAITPYSQTLTQTGITGTPIWTVTQGTLPAGLTLNASTGVIAGTPTTISVSKFMVEVTGGSCPQTMDYTIRIINNCPTSTYVTLAPVNLTIGNSCTIPAVPVPFNGAIWSISTGTLPTGLTIDPNTGTISGSPTSVTTLPFTVRATNGVCTKWYASTIRVYCPNIRFNTGAAYDGLVNMPYTLDASVTGNNAPVTYTLYPTLPQGLTLNANTGLISGIPTVISPSGPWQSAETDYTVTATQNLGNCSVSKSFRFKISNCPSIVFNTALATDAFVGTTYILDAGATRNIAPLTYSVAPNLPAGLTLNVNTGLISGTPTIVTASNYYTVTATQATGNCSGSRVYIFAVRTSNFTSDLNYVWAKATEGASEIYRGINNVVVDASGNVYSFGTFAGIVDFDPGVGVTNFNGAMMGGGSSMFISKLDVNGNLVWVKVIYGTSNGTAGGRSIALDASNNVYINGGFYGLVDFDPGISITSLGASSNGYPTYNGMFTTKFDTNGSFMWAKAVNFLSSSITDIHMSVDTFGNIYTSGSFGGTVDFDPNSGIVSLTAVSSEDIFISKLDTNGNLLWAKMFGGTGIRDRVDNIAVDINGNCYINGFFDDIMDFDPSVGVYNLNGYGLSMFIAKLDTNGNFAFAKVIVGISDYSGLFFTKMALDAFGNIYTSGKFRGTIDFNPNPATNNLTSTLDAGGIFNDDIFISKLDNMGNFIYAKTINASRQAIAIDAFGSIYINVVPYQYYTTTNTIDFDPGIGVVSLPPQSTTPTSSIRNNPYLVKLDNNGDFAWVKDTGYAVSYDNSTGYYVWQSPNPASMITDIYGSLYAIGNFSGTLDFDFNAGIANITVNTGSMYIAKYSKCSNVISFTNTNTTTATVGVSYNLNASATTSTGALTYSIVPALPTGLSLNANTGIISGTPTVSTSVTTYYVTAAQGVCSAIQSYTFPVVCVGVITINPANLSNGTLGTTYNQTISQTGLAGTPVSSISAGSLPSGLSIGSGTGIIIGIPTTVGTSNFTVSVTNGSCTQTKVYSIVISCPIITFTNITASNATVGTTFSLDAGVTGNTSTVIYSILPALPAGLSLNTTTGAISGTPIMAELSATYTVRATQGTCNITQGYTFAVVCDVIAINQVNLNNGTVGATYNQLITQTGLIGTPMWSIGTGILPNGLNISNTTGIISGIPTTIGTFNFTVSVSNGGCSQVKPFTIIIVGCPIINILSAILPNSLINVPYSQTLSQTGLVGVPTWSVSAGTLPNGLMLSPTTGIISGITTMNGLFPFTISVTDGTCTKTQAYSITVGCGTITTVLPASILINVPFSQTLTQTGLSGTLTWSDDFSLPDGLSLDSVTGEITGTPYQTGTYTFTIEVTDNNAVCIASQTYTIVVACPTITINPTTLPNATIGTPYVQTLTQTGLSTFYWSESNGALPDGLILDSATGEITGTPYQSGTYTITIGVEDGNGTCTASRTYTIVANCPTVTTGIVALPNGTLGTAYNQPITQIGFVGVGDMWLVSSGDLPDGLALGFSTGEITGTPTLLGTFTFTVEVAYGDCIQSKVFTIIIGTAPVVATQTITFNTLAPVTYGLVPFALVGNASSSLPVSYASANTAVATVSGNTITIVGAGTTTITAIQTGNSSYSAATPMTQQLTVLKKDLTVTAPNISLMPDCDGGRAGADPMPTTFVLTYTGFVYNETVAVLTTLPTTITQIVPGRSARYLVIASGAQADYYYFIYVDGMITIEPCPFWRPTTTAVTAPNATGDTSLEEWLSNQIKVYPNPSKADFTVDFGSLNLGKSLVRVYDAQGKTVFSSETEINNNTMKITLENAASGLYLLEIDSKKGRVIKRLIKMD